MALIALAGDKGSPGATTTALTLALAWPGPVVLVEADPFGGDLASRLTDGRGRFDLADQPNLLTFAAAARRGRSAGLLRAHAQTTTGGLRVVRGPASAAQAAGMDRLWPGVAQALDETAAGGAADGQPGSDAIVDLGRLWPGSPTTPVAVAADQTVVVGAGTAEGLVHLRERVRGLAPLRIRLAVALVADGRRGDEAARAAAEVLRADGLPAPVLGFIAHDRRAVAALHRGERSARVGLSLLARSAGHVARRLAAARVEATGGGDRT